ncbi:MAG: GDYXXLXY domain-containing protein [Elainellaceae cyanobacterium]
MTFNPAERPARPAANRSSDNPAERPPSHNGRNNGRSRGRKLWRFWLPLALQLALIFLAPARAIYTTTTGQTVLLETVPVDPYDLLRGYYVTLRYQISQEETLDNLPGWESLSKETRSAPLPLYIVMQAPGDSPRGGENAPWKPVRVSRDRPSLETDQVTLKGEYRWGRLTYGLERYYIPEDQRVEINERIAQLQRSEPDRYLVEVKVDAQGQSLPVSLWVGDENYRF